MKKKLLLSAFILFLATKHIFSQETKFSFETSEGFTLGNFNGQKGWSNWGYVDASHSQVVNTIASLGNNSVSITANAEQEENWGGIFYDVPNYPRMSISADVYMDSVGASDYDMLTLYSMDVEEYERLGGFYYNFDSTLEVGDFTSITTKSWQANKWYNLKVNVDFSTKKIEYFIDQVKVLTSTFNSQVTSIKEFDFEFDNYQSGFKVDNVKIQNLDNLDIHNVDKVQIQLYPNPTADVLNIKGVKELDVLSVFDASGKLVYQSQSLSPIDVKSWKSGLYVVKIKTKTSEFINKFLKN